MENSKLPAREIQVCQRLIELRDLLGYDQKKLGLALGVSRDRLASYENFRAPLRYDLGDLLCSTFDINQRWFATGQLPQLQYLNVPKGMIDEETSPRALFTEVYDQQLKSYIETSLDSASGVIWHRDSQGNGIRMVRPEELDLHLVSNNEWRIRRSGSKPKIDPAELFEPLLISKIRRAFAELKPELRSKFFRHIGRAMSAFQSEHKSDDKTSANEIGTVTLQPPGSSHEST